MTKLGDNSTALIAEHKRAIESLADLIERQAKVETVRYQAKVIISINEDIMTAVCGSDTWKPSSNVDSEKKESDK